MIERVLAEVVQMLRNLSGLLDKGVAHAEATEGVTVESLLEGRLAPDMFNLTRQIQIAADNAKFIAARLSGVEPPAWEDEEKTVEELKARLEMGIAYVTGQLETGDFSGWEERQVTLSFLPGMYVLGSDYLHEFALPNFFFHVTTAYAILRSAGVEIGKRDFIGHMSFKPLPKD